jgi:hypothetical protein
MADLGKKLLEVLLTYIWNSMFSVDTKMNDIASFLIMIQFPSSECIVLPTKFKCHHLLIFQTSYFLSNEMFLCKGFQQFATNQIHNEAIRKIMLPITSE